MSSLDDRRNVRIVSLLKDHREQIPATVLIFFYGEEHLVPIQSKLIVDQSDGTKNRWISSLSFDTALTSLEFNDRARFDKHGRDPAGYTVCARNKLDFCYLQLLTKGIGLRALRCRSGRWRWRFRCSRKMGRSSRSASRTRTRTQT